MKPEVPNLRAATVIVRRGNGLRHEFIAWLPDEVVAAKFSTFVAEQDCQLLDISPHHVRLRIGRGGPLPGSRARLTFPVDLYVTLKRDEHLTGSMTRVIAELRPQVRNVSREAVEFRCRQILQVLRDSLIARDLEEAVYRRSTGSETAA